MLRLFCRHKNLTFPLTPDRTRCAYVACLDCGRHFDYYWETMTRGKERFDEPSRPPHADLTTIDAHHDWPYKPVAEGDKRW